MNWKRAAILVSMLFVCGSFTMAQSTHWLHISVEKAGAEGEQVKVNVPMGLVSTVLPMIEENGLTKGKLPLDKMPLTVSQLREIWQSLRSEGDFELASVQDGETDVRIFKEGDYLYVRSSEAAKEEVKVTIPAPVVDALLSGEGEELNIMAAARALAESDEGELVSVKDGDETVRVWVDTTNASE